MHTGWECLGVDQRDEMQKAWLTEATGAPAGTHPWERFGAGYDPKVGFASIWLNYEVPGEA